MQAVILAGGRGTRLGETTDIIPKPLVKIGDRPIIQHIIDRYRRYNVNDIIVAGGYLCEQLSDYFADDDQVRVVDTGIDTQTGGRLKRLSEYLTDTFCFTYGDGLSDIDINKLLKFHKRNNAMCTVTTVRPPARFGRVRTRAGFVTGFAEKRQTDEGKINGGYWVCHPSVLTLIDGDSMPWEAYPVRWLVEHRQMAAYEHTGFWQCMDTPHDVAMLNDMWKEGAPWIG